ncbi:MAG TPA: hypothetical protein DCL35_00760 [Candidatus Omnitrophica bacterium]|nr:hypothetical protein [Candidatus Omnitrophota bacterium]
MAYFLDSPISFLHDPLSLFFLAVIAVVALPAFVYSIGYLERYPRSKRIEGHILFAAFVLSMAAVVTLDHAFAFLVAWEIMSLTSYFLVLFERENELSIQAATIYVIMTHAGTAFLIAAFLMFYRFAGSFDFQAIKIACQTMPAQTKNIIFIFLLIGFGTKAGIVPLHIWLPYAHPQAPSHISSLMSGVMIKTAVYGILRFIITILGADTTWWGILIMILAAISCLVGIIYALMENNIKKLLAYSSIENMGIILFGVGACMFFLSKGWTMLAVLSLIAGLYHLINHAIFKGLLFLGSGSIYHATGTLNIEKQGGLIHRMPYTAGTFLVGSVAIAGLPPLNGFLSEWLTFQTFFLGATQGNGGIKVLFGLCAAILALTSGLAAACFVKAFGITFLGLPRSKHSQDAKKSPAAMKLGMLFLSILIFVFSFGACFIIRKLTSICGHITGINTDAMNFTVNNLTVTPWASKGIYLSTPAIAAVLSTIMLVAGSAIYFILCRRKNIIYNTWDCGYYKLGARNEYTATAYSKPFRILFSFFLLPHRRTKKIWESFYHVKSFSYETGTTSIFKKYAYKPFLNAIFGSAELIKRMQAGSIHIYIGYIFITIILLLIFKDRF